MYWKLILKTPRCVQLWANQTKFEANSEFSDSLVLLTAQFERMSGSHYVNYVSDVGIRTAAHLPNPGGAGLFLHNYFCHTILLSQYYVYLWELTRYTNESYYMSKICSLIGEFRYWCWGKWLSELFLMTEACTVRWSVRMSRKPEVPKKKKRHESQTYKKKYNG